MDKFIRQTILEIIDNFSENEKIQLHNEYCNYSNAECNVFSYEDINELASDLTPTEIIETYGDVANCDKWYFNGYGNAVALDYIDNLIDTSAIADIVESGEGLNFYEFYEIIELINNLDDILDDIQEELINQDITNININNKSMVKEIIEDTVDIYIEFEDKENLINALIIELQGE
mgnify:CR=1 FL=1